MKFNKAKAFQPALTWFKENEWKPFPFQKQTWEAYLTGKSGLVNAPTGSGKTYSLMIPILLEFLQQTSVDDPEAKNNGLQVIWITPIRALAKEIKNAGTRAAKALGLNWEFGIRSGDTKASARTKQKKKPPEVLITTPESLHLLLASAEYSKFFKNLKTVVIDEWHELIGTKRGVQIELALSRLRGKCPSLKTWGISATIGNMEEAVEVLLGPDYKKGNWEIIRSKLKKKIVIETVLPDEIERFPWSGHLGITLLPKVLPLIYQSKTTLIFTNTRAQCEIWYQRLLEADGDLAGQIAMHHGSISRELRNWVEESLHTEQLKAVVCTSSLDLGVDFRPVETIVQIGSPKGVARFMQRAGRSGHQPGATSRIHFVPTNSLELIEASALRTAIKNQDLEARYPYIRSFDVLAQYLVTLATSEGFEPVSTLAEIRTTYAFNSVTDEEWNWLINFITTGGPSMDAYEDMRRVGFHTGLYRIMNKHMATRQRLSMGTIVGNSSMKVKYLRGGKIGQVEEWFISQVKPGETFWFAGRSLELLHIRGMDVIVKKSKKKRGKIPSWQGGRLPLSSQLSEELRKKVALLSRGKYPDAELKKLKPLTDLQAHRSLVPNENELLIEYFKSREGFHLLVYPFEGRAVHQGISTLMAWRISQLQPISFTIAMNDYGFELLSDTEIPIDTALKNDVFSTVNLTQDIQSSVNSVEMAMRQFREIAAISGLVFKGYPTKQKRIKHLQSSAELFFKAFAEYEPDNLLLLQAYEEVMSFQLEEVRLRTALRRIERQEIKLMRPPKATPFSFPIIVDRLRERLSSEKLQDRIDKMRLQLVR